MLHARDLTYCNRSNGSKAFRWCRGWYSTSPSPVVPARQRPPTSTSRPPTPHLLISGEAGAGMHGNAQRCDPFQMYVCTYLVSTGSQSSYHSQRAPTQDLSLIPRPHTTSHQRLNLVADDRNHVAWTIGQWMEVGYDASQRARDHLTLLHFESALKWIGPTYVKQRRKRHRDV